jgi:hypothetical protein
MRCLHWTAVLTLTLSLAMTESGATEPAPEISASNAQPPRSNTPRTRWVTMATIRKVDESTEGNVEPAETPEKLCKLHAFPEAAHFAWLGFGREGEPIPRDQLTIYEGMQIAADCFGNYEVRYQVEAPLVEITLRMQLHFQTLTGKTGTITLAPIRISPQSDDDNNSTSQSFQVVHRGNSVALEHAMIELQNECCQGALSPLGPDCGPFSRTGTARFGAIPRK